MDNFPLAIGSDHAGYCLKMALLKFLDEKNIKYKDFGVFDEVSADYPDYAEKVAVSITSGEYNQGLLICGTGIGMSIAANRFKGIRAALCHDPHAAKMSRKHNDANILVMGANITAPVLAKEILEVWLNEDFEGGRHERRISKIDFL